MGGTALAANSWYVVSGDTGNQIKYYKDENATTYSNRWSQATNTSTDINTFLNDAAVLSGDTVYIKAGTYILSGEIDLTSKLLHLYGGFSGTEETSSDRESNIGTTLNANADSSNQRRVLNITTNSTIDSFTITGGNYSGSGGIRISSSSPTITNCTITGNKVTRNGYNGGGIYITGNNSTPTIINLGLSESREPFTRLLTQGMVIKDGAKMSKSLGNTVDPTEMVKKYGADTIRLFILFAAPPNNDLEWSDRNVEGAHRFLNRVWRYVEENAENLRKHGEIIPMSEIKAPGLRELKRKIHTTIKSVTDDISAEKQFNTAIARLMELTNAIYAVNDDSPVAWDIKREAVETLLNCLSPFCPHITEELWQMLGHDEMLCLSSWPEADESAMVQDSVTVVVQVNGKMRGKFERPAGMDKDELAKSIMAEEFIAGKIAGKEIVKVIAVPDKLVNIVVKG